MFYLLFLGNQRSIKNINILQLLIINPSTNQSINLRNKRDTNENFMFHADL